MESEKLNKILNTVFFDNSIEDYAQAFITLLFVYLIINIFQFILNRRVRKFFTKNNYDLDNLILEIVSSTNFLLKLTIAIYFSSSTLVINTNLKNLIETFSLLFVTVFIVRMIQRIISYFVIKYEKYQSKLDGNIESEFGKGMIRTIIQIINISIWLIAILLILDNMGFDASALIASLGIGGIVIAFAFQNILEDLFASSSIFFDKPFEVGDFLLVEGQYGTVEKIGLKTSRLRALDGEELIIPNKSLTQGTINNFKKLQSRRVSFKIGVTYETTHEKLKKINKIVEKIFENIENAELSRVHFFEFGDFSLNFEIVFMVHDSSYNTYMDIRQKVNFELIDIFEKEGIEFAYPTQKILLNK